MAVMEPSLSDDILALLCIVVVSLFGLISNGLSLLITTTNSHFRNAYGTLCTIVLLCNIQTISIILIWGAVVLITNYRELSSPKSFIALIPGCLANASLYGAVVLHLLIAVNRYCAFAYPLKYHFYWSIAKARKAGIVAYFLGFLPCFPSIFEPCTPIFNLRSKYCWSYSDTVCGNLNSIFDVTTVISSSIIVGCINFVTFIKMRNYLKRRKTAPMMVNNFVSRKREIFFFKQTCAVGFVIISSSVIFFISQHVPINKWITFGVCTISWVMAHALEGFVVLIFNRHHLYYLRSDIYFLWIKKLCGNET